MTTEIQIIDRGGLVKLFGATIRVVPPPPPPPSEERTVAPAAAAAAACRTEHRAALQVLGDDKMPRIDDDEAQRTIEENQAPPAKSKERCGSPADVREVEAGDEEDKDHKPCVETHETRKQQEKQQQQQEDENDKESLTKKKPDMLLPCPRCDSMDTKFCYYNNYNVNQPRHFCRECQRYWTAGGAVRPNMPVGAGKRKKPSRVGAGGVRCHQQDMSAADQAGTASPPGDGDQGSILSFGDGMVSPSSNNSSVMRQRQLSAEQPSLRVESCHFAAPQVPWPVKGGVANPPPPPLYFYGGNQTPPASAVCGVRADGGFTSSPQPVHLCWAPTAAAGWQVFSFVPWAPQMPSYHPAPTPSPAIHAPIAVRKHSHTSSHSHSHSHDADRHSYGSSVVDDSWSRQSSSSLEMSPSAPKPAGAAKKRSFAIMEEEEDKEVSAWRSYQLRTDTSGRRTEVESKVLHSNPAAMLRSISFQETV